MKVRGMQIYASPDAATTDLHLPPVAGAPLEHRHKGLGSGGNLRAAVFGVNDGLVSNASLILGVAGAGADAKAVVAAGEYVSVRSQRELFEYQIALERDELEQYPEAEAQELALIYEAKGLPKREAEQVARRIVADPEHALDTLAREELGLNPGELGSPIGAAASSFGAFATGALLPLVPFVVASGGSALPISIGITAVALFAIGGTLSLFTGRNAFASGARMLALGAAAGAVTYAIGSLVGVAVG
jgi:VIT1/CCC1 family predicted Fe2+/Mn2+ transporter